MTGRLFQYNTLGALMLGHFDGEFTAGELLDRGNLGIGTFNAMDGEMIVFNDSVYYVAHSGQVKKVGKGTKTPYAAVVNFEADHSKIIDQPFDFHDLEKNYDKLFETTHNFFAVKIEGRFKNVKCRSGKRQEKPYPKFVKATEEQNEFSREDVYGTALGFFTPVLFGRVSAAGFHMHFLSDDKEFGGHIMEFTVEEGKIFTQEIYSLEQEFPKESLDFSNIDGHQLLDEIDKAEK